MDTQHRASPAAAAVSNYPYHTEQLSYPIPPQISPAHTYYGRGRLHNLTEHSMLHAAPHHSPYPLPAFPSAPRREDARDSPSPPSEAIFAPNAHQLYCHATTVAAAAAAAAAAAGAGAPDSPGGLGGNHYAPSTSIPRLPPILQVEKQQVTTSATQAASASRRRNEAHFQCPVPGCGSTFTRRFNLRGHLRSHTEERPYVCEWPGCNKGFARQHDCKRHQALHSSKTHANICAGCGKTFSRLDALNRHLRSEGGADCRSAHAQSQAQAGGSNIQSNRSDESDDWEAPRERSASVSTSGEGSGTPAPLT